MSTRQPDELDLDSLLEQAREYKKDGNVSSSVTRVLNLLGQTHPFPILRLAELESWVESESHRVILDGTYPTRTQETSRSVLLPPSREDESEPDPSSLTQLLQRLGGELSRFGDKFRTVDDSPSTDSEDSR